MAQRKVLVTGANGQLGHALRDIAGAYPEFSFLFLSREDLAIHHFDLVRHFFEGYHPDVCINCAAYTAVERAESEPELARIVNAESVGVLAAVCRAHGTKFVHISTDYVFRGDARTPYTVEAPTDPQTAYGAGKREGELLALEHDPEAAIIRTSWVYYTHGKNFVKTMIRLMRQQPSVRVVNDQFGSPTYAGDLAECILQMLRSGRPMKGIYHFSNEGVISWYDFAVAIRDILGVSTEVIPIPTSEFPSPVKRPAYTALDKTRLVEDFGIAMQPWRERLKACMDALAAMGD